MPKKSVKRKKKPFALLLVIVFILSVFAFAVSQNLFFQEEDDDSMAKALNSMQALRFAIDLVAVDGNISALNLLPGEECTAESLGDTGCVMEKLFTCEKDGEGYFWNGTGRCEVK